MAEPWIGVDLDGTLARTDGSTDGIGDPIPEMVERVRAWLANGIVVKIVTARIGSLDKDNDRDEIKAVRLAIRNWCEKHVGSRLEVTGSKDYGMLILYDDRAVQVKTNSGALAVDDETRACASLAVDARSEQHANYEVWCEACNFIKNKIMDRLKRDSAC
jgi:hypothetical protein